MIDRDYFTFDELMARWSIEKRDIHYLIANGDVTPSIVWRDKVTVCQWEPDLQAGGLYLSAVKDDEFQDQSARIPRWVYLRLPSILGPFDYRFSYATSDRFLLPKEFSGNWFRLLDTSTEWQGTAEITPGWIESNAVFMNADVEDCELILQPGLLEKKPLENPLTSDAREKPLTTVSDNTLVATIAALLGSFPKGKQPSGKDLERAAASIGVSVSDDSIRKALNLAKEIAPSLKSA